MENIDVLKAVAIALILCLAIIPGIIPLTFSCCKRNQKCLANTHTFSGGVFITIGLLHIYPECVIGYRDKYPEMAEHIALPEVLFIMGYILILIFDKVMCGHHHHHDHGEHEHGHGGHQCQHHHTQQKKEERGRSPRTDRELLEKERRLTHVSSIKVNGFHPAPESEGSPSSDQVEINKESEPNSPTLQKRESQQSLTSKGQRESIAMRSSTVATSVTLITNGTHKHKHHNHHKSSFCAGAVIIGALSVHSFFEGLALGVLPHKSEVFGLLVGIILHNWAESLSIVRMKEMGQGAGLVKRDKNQQHKVGNIILLIIYSIVSPIGIGIGWALLKYSPPLVAIIASALAGGTFLYVGAAEVVSQDFQGHGLWRKAFYYSFGAVLMIVFSAITENTTEHSH